MKQLLYISHCLPYPPDKGERVRAYHELLALSGEFEITLLCLSRGSPKDAAAALQHLQPLCARTVMAPAGGVRGLLRGALGLLAGRSVSEGYFAASGLEDLIASLAPRGGFDLVVGYCSATLPLVLAAPAAARIMDIVDVDSLKWAAYARQSHWPLSGLYAREAAAVRSLEARAAARCQAVFYVSASEAQAASAGETVRAAPNGVDSDYFDLRHGASLSAQAAVFLGSMDYRPNIEAVCWYAEHVHAPLRQRLGELEFWIVGRRPAGTVRRLERLGGVHVTGTVSDVRPYVARARLAVAPLMIARGVQNKVLEALAMQRPVVASPAAIEGLDLQDCPAVISAQDAPQWIETVESLVGDPQRCGCLGRQGRRSVLERYSWHDCLEPLVKTCRELTASRPAAAIRGRTILCFASGYDAPPTSKHHVMHELARHNTVLWVCYHGSRTPTMAAHDLKYLAARLRNVFAGMRTVRENLHVLTPLVVPLPGSAAAKALNRRLLKWQIARALARLQRGPLQIWSFCPDVAYLVEGFDAERVLYYCVDDFASFSGYDSRLMLSQEAALCRRANLVVTTSQSLYEAKKALARDTVLVPHGVDWDHFARALSESTAAAPADIDVIPRPRVGFFGLIRDWVDLDLIAAVARRRQQWHFVFLGDSAVDLTPLRTLPNVHFLGPRPYGSLPDYCRAMDAAMVPFKLNALTAAVNPIKLREYLSAGLGVVSTPLPEVQALGDLVEIASGPEAFEAAVGRLLAADRRQRVRRSQSMSDQTWRQKVQEISRRLMSGDVSLEGGA
ncbi:MAG: TIGR03087 family PEP-CTERM/XrtA system glycosyltransferase [Planctomycetaceae bacterium]|nr:TIGR03087 family PEP-CTERM/XrtA system glycosyltransferase [Planctomycetaceae bacterium]